MPFLRKGFDLLFLSQLHGVLRVILEPLIGNIPIVGAVSMFFIRRPVRESVGGWGMGKQRKQDREGECRQLWGMEEGIDKKAEFWQLLAGCDDVTICSVLIPCSFLPDPGYQLDRDDQPAGYPRTQVSRVY